MKIQKIGIIGAGNMGSGIAQKVAQEGIQVVMVDVEDRFVQRGLDNIKQTLSEGVKRKIFTEEQTKEILSRIKGTTNRDEIKDADLVIEAIFLLGSRWACCNNGIASSYLFDRIRRIP